MMKYVSTGSVTGILSALALLAGLYGKPALQVFLADPATTQMVLQLLGAVGALVAGFLQGIKPDQPK